MFGKSLLGANGGGTPGVDLTSGLVAHYLLNNNADDNHGIYDGTVVGTVDFQGDQVDTLSGSITIPSTGGVWCSYWEDTGTGMTHVTTSTVPASLSTNKYSNLRIYNAVKDASFMAELLAEGYYPKPLPLPTTDGLIAHYPLTGTAEDTTGNYDSTEVSATYIDDAEFGSVFSGTGSITINTTATGLATWCCYWVDSGAGWVFTKATTIPSSLATNKYRNLRLYSLTPSTALQNEIEAYEKNFRPIDIDDGLTYYYQLADNSLDNYYNQSDGIDTLMTYNGLSGVFNGIDGYIKSGFSLSTANDYSISLWFNTNETVLSQILGWYKGTGANQRAYFSASTTGVTIQFGTNTSASATISISSGYHHAVITKTGTSYDLYIDNTLVIENYIGAYDATYTDLVYGLGCIYRTDTFVTSEHSDCLVSKYRVYSKVVTPERIAVIYNTEKGDFGL